MRASYDCADHVSFCLVAHTCYAMIRGNHILESTAVYHISLFSIAVAEKFDEERRKSKVWCRTGQTGMTFICVRLYVVDMSDCDYLDQSYGNI